MRGGSENCVDGFMDSGTRNHNLHVDFCISPYYDNKSPYIDIHVIFVA